MTDKLYVLTNNNSEENFPDHQTGFFTHHCPCIINPMRAHNGNFQGLKLRAFFLTLDQDHYYHHVVIPAETISNSYQNCFKFVA